MKDLIAINEHCNCDQFMQVYFRGLRVYGSGVHWDLIQRSPLRAQSVTSFIRLTRLKLFPQVVMEVEGGMEMSERFSLMHTNKTKEMSIDF